MNGPAATLTAIVVTYNSRDAVGALLGSLPAACGDLPCHVVVVDNASGDGTVEAVRAAAPSAQVIEAGANVGYAAAINLGLVHRRDDGPVLVLNPDVVLAPGSVVRLGRTLAATGAGIVVPRLVDPDGRTHHSLRRDPSALRAWGEALLGGTRAGRIPALGETVVDPRRYEVGGRADWATGAVLLISSACAGAVGPWDERFFLYSEETDFALRARALGFALWFEPAARALHVGGASNTAPPLYALMARSRVRCYRKHHGALSTALYRAGVVTNEALRAALGRPTHRAALRTVLRPAAGQGCRAG